MQENCEVTSKIFTTNAGIKLGYEMTGLGLKKKWVVLLHGLGGRAGAWRWVCEELWKMGYGSVAIDLVGHGVSTQPKDTKYYRIKAQAELVTELVEALHLGRVILVGHCFGGMVAQEMRKIREWDEVILVSTKNEAGRVEKLFARVARGTADILPRTKPSELVNCAKYLGTPDYHIPRLWADVRGMSLRGYLYGLATAMEYGGRVGGSEGRGKLRVVVGEKDRVYSTKISQKVAREYGTSCTVIPDANHVLVLNEPKKLAGVIASQTVPK